jgi:di/tricarboxylate transporter
LFKTFDFTLGGGVLVILGLVYCLTAGRFLGDKIWGKRPDDDADYDIHPVAANYKKSKMIIMAVIFLLTVVFYITEWIPLAITSSSAAILCIITGCIPQKKAFTAVNWNIVGRLAGCLGLAKALESAGGTKLIAQAFSNVVGDSLSPFLLFAILVLLVQVVSEFMSNSTAILIVLPIVLSIAPQLHLNPYSFALGITLASGVALSCPLASSTLGMSMSVGYKFNDYFKYSIFYDILAYLVIIAMVPAIYGLTI